MSTLKIKDIKPEYAAKEVRDASGNVLSWDQVLKHYPNYEIEVDALGRPVLYKDDKDYNYLRQKVENDNKGPYAATKWLLGQQVALPLGALGVVTAPAAITVGGIAGGVGGDILGNYASDWLFNNPDKEYKLNQDITITPRTATRLGGSLVGGIAGGAGAYKTLLNVVKPVKRFVKDVANGNVKFRIPIEQNKYYRTLHSNERDNYINAINDAFETGIIRSNPNGSKSALDSPEHFIGPYFHKGNPRLSSEDKAIIVSKETPDLQWANINNHDSKFTPANFGLYTPLYKGVPNKAPAKYFEYYERGANPISKYLWFKKSFDGATIPPDLKPFDYGKNSNILVHMDYGDHSGWNGNGAYIKNGLLFPGEGPVDLKNYIWFNEDKPYAMGINGRPFTRAIVTTKTDDFTRVRDMKEPVGLWDPTTKNSFVLSSEYVTPYSIDINKSFVFNIDPTTGLITLIQ